MPNIDWPGLLRWSCSQSDGTQPSNLGPLSSEDQTFLQGAIEEAMKNSKDVEKEIVEAASHLVHEDSNIALKALDEMDRCLDESPEVARHIHQSNVLELLIKAIQRMEEEVVNKSLQILSLCISNNPDVQEAFFNFSGLSILTSRWETAVTDTMRIRCMSAIGSAIRNHEISERYFVGLGGVQKLCQAMHNLNFKIQEKAASLSRHLVVASRIRFTSDTLNLFCDGIICLLRNQDVSITGIQYGDSCCNLTLAFIQHNGNNLEFSNNMSRLRAAIWSRICYLQQYQALNLEDDLSAEISTLNEALSLLDFPPVLKSSDSESQKQEPVMLSLKNRS